MKKILLITLIANTISAIPNNPDFARRFGSNSHIYNTPLYFNTGRCRTKKPANCNYRKKIKKEIAQKILR